MGFLTTLLLAATLGLFPAADPDPVGVWPLQPQPEVVRPFDPPDSPYGAGHRGVDLLGHVGQPVLSALPGTVTYAGSLAGRGVVVVDHGATRTTYEPVAATVGVGIPVTAGTPIGALELAGSHCFPRACLHWGWIEGETYLDPLRLVGAGPVRLLPLWRDQPLDRSAPVPSGLGLTAWSRPIGASTGSPEPPGTRPLATAPPRPDPLHGCRSDSSLCRTYPT